MKQLILFAIVLFCIDMIWLKGAAKMHSDNVEAVQNTKLNAQYKWGLAFYALAAVAFVYIIQPMSKNKVRDAIVYGSLLGLLMYGTFDFTNKAIFTNYSTCYAIMDTLWGMIAMGVASGITTHLLLKY